MAFVIQVLNILYFTPKLLAISVLFAQSAKHSLTASSINSTGYLL